MDLCFSAFTPYQPLFLDATPGSLPLTIRAALPKDIKSLAEVLTDSFHTHQGKKSWFVPLLKLGICEDLRTRLASESSHYLCLVASIPLRADSSYSGYGEEIVGTAEVSVHSPFSWFKSSEKYPYISNLAVQSCYRRKGVARNLLLCCEQTAHRWGFAEIALHVLENNYQAQQLYFRSGYQLKYIETGVASLLFKHPRRFLLNKLIQQ